MFVFFAYNLVIAFLFPLWFSFFLWALYKQNEKNISRQHFGNIDIPQKGVRKRVWFHAASLGEINCAIPVIQCLKASDPNIEILVSTMAEAGQHRARKELGKSIDFLFFLPLDMLPFQLRAMSRIRPDLVAVVETELWPNFFWATKKYQSKLLLINGRMSDRAFKRNKSVALLYRWTLSHVDQTLVQSEKDAAYYQHYQAPNVQVIGSSKFDEALQVYSKSPEQIREGLGISQEDFVLVIGSTHGRGEENFVLAALQKAGVESIYVIHAPRYLAEVDKLAEQVQKRFGSVAQHSKRETGKYLILDTYGELGEIYQIADITIVGGGFVQRGGHNILQPLALGKPVLHGPFMRNNEKILELAEPYGCTFSCGHPDELAETIQMLKSSPQRRAEIAERAKCFVQEHRGASSRYVKLILDSLNDS